MNKLLRRQVRHAVGNLSGHLDYLGQTERLRKLVLKCDHDNGFNLTDKSVSTINNRHLFEAELEVRW